MPRTIPDPVWNIDRNPRCTSCGKHERSWTRPECRAFAVGACIGVVFVPALLYYQVAGPGFWAVFGTIFMTPILAGAALLPPVRLVLRMRWGRRPRPDRGWCDCGDGA